ncbi:hypothetical protein [Amycolatopsis albispora]|uniref:Uncharacterized protein n=1 Tax=Amycolatopsis albispora TaxID=1804986 RepID=A0A344LIW3_9PSEU|nr:hypothetical protein [Amycolatopsis albispora]AXB47987.1 hypothetical protein A4R43_40690 [Amycolatopsis albispora]
MAGSPKFGRIDPLCWVVVVPMVVVSVVLIVFVGLRDVGIGLAVLAVLLLVFDSWANRPRPELEDDDTGGRRTPPPANRQRPAQQRPAQQRPARAPQQRQQPRQPQRPQQRPRRPQARR